MSHEHIHFVTGRLAQQSLRKILAQLADDIGFDFSIDVLPITVAALMTPPWIAKHIQVPQQATLILLPGYCQGDLAPLQAASNIPFKFGPRDLRQLYSHFTREKISDDYGAYDVEIIAEINHCPRLALATIRDLAAALASDGADVIDLGCEPGETWTDVGQTVQALCEDGYRVSIDSFNVREIEQAVRGGAELVLSVNSSNRKAAGDWGVEVVAIPDEPTNLASLDETVNHLDQLGIPLRVDPILEPISFGFAESLGRYLRVRREYPDAEMMMGVGNLTELTDVDSVGVNTLLLGFCQELGIRSVLTTQVIGWARTSVRECDLARRLMHYAVAQKVLPKHVESRLLMLRDADIVEPTHDALDQLAAEIRDHNIRIFSGDDQVHLVSSDLHLHERDPFVLFESLLETISSADVRKPIDASHAFYLGYEMCKAITASTLGKNYQQDESLDWGLASRHEGRHHTKRHHLKKRPGDKKS